MNTFEYIRRLEKIKIGDVRVIGIKSVQENKGDVIEDSVLSNMQGLTFSGTEISENPPFFDWNETGQFHKNLKFQSDKKIEFTSKGEGAEAIFSTFDHSETIAPHAITLSPTTLDKIRQSFIKNLKSKL